jgi:hypothetical protein
MQQELYFGGSDYQHERDVDRLTNQLERVYKVMQDSTWKTLNDISTLTGDPPASISAQLRHLRKPRFGGHIVEKRYINNGLYEYRLILRSENIK